MRSIQPACYAFRRRFHDFDDLAAAARQWDLDLLQLDQGTFCGDLLQFGVEGVHVAEAHFARRLLQRGHPPPGMRTLGIPAKRSVNFVWRGQQISGNDVVIFPRGAELESTSPPGFHVYTCSFPEELLASACHSLQINDLDALRQEACVARCSESALRPVRTCLQQLCRSISGPRSTMVKHQFAAKATRDLPARLLTAIAASHASDAFATTRNRHLALVRAEGYIEQYASEMIHIRDICSAARCSQRTLEYAFVERYGVTPKAFLTAHRLNSARRQLRVAEASEEKVADIANHCGFWHMGQFAADYHKHFGELPSETLRRAI